MYFWDIKKISYVIRLEGFILLDFMIYRLWGFFFFISVILSFFMVRLLIYIVVGLG